MKDCFFQYRKGLYEALSTLTYEGDAIEVLEYAPNDYETPYIQILNMSSTLNDDQSTFMQMLSVDIMVVTSHVGSPEKFGSKQSDDIMTSIMELLITRGVTPADVAKHITMDDFTDGGCYFVALNYFPDFDGVKTTVRKVLTIQTGIDEN